MKNKTNYGGLYTMLHNPYKIVKMFEEEIANYTGAPYAVAVDSCTSALFLCCVMLNVREVDIPSKTYLSVPQSIIHAGGIPVFNKSRDKWDGIYQLRPYPIWDAAKRFTHDMFIGKDGSPCLMCLSFHMKKHLPIGKGGVILTNEPDWVDWLKKARYEGRNEILYKKDSINSLGWNMYMTPQEAAVGLALMQQNPLYNEDLNEPGGYRDLTEFPVFSEYKVIGE
jgi:dTDP-4-amino-4,6-dideoxygalactose transaminase